MSADLAAAEQAVAESGRILASHPPVDQRWQAARTHEANLLRRAELRTAAGTAAYADRRAIETDRLRGFELAADAGIDAYSLSTPGGAA